ncbi:uncharacterized protein LOC127278237 [Leptopilina boulardi]|uniref:uncharacterized protein LOC127278237 n=1 Tax=Leptopilina boulardi TaxID=63433 RepID=UPI0021F682C3|nr:uncharacterized protein LOC127278237 [Leptopilina boulardi]
MDIKLPTVQPDEKDEYISGKETFVYDWDHNYTLKRLTPLHQDCNLDDSLQEEVATLDQESEPLLHQHLDDSLPEEVATVDQVNEPLPQQEINNNDNNNNCFQNVENQTSSGRIVQPKRFLTYKTYERYYGTNHRWHKSGRPKKLPQHGIPYTYMRCAYQYKSKCPGRALLYDDEIEFVYITKDHLEKCKFNVDAAHQRSALLEKSAANPDNPSKVFKEVRRENTNWESSLPYEFLQRTLRRWLRGGCPAVPKHIVDVEEVLNNPVWQQRMTYCIKEENHKVLVKSVTDADNFCHIIFFSPDFLSKVLEIDVSSATVDGTFRTVPWLKGAYQILIFSVFSFGKITPLFFVMMSAKSFRAYSSVAQKIKELAPSLKIDKLTCDFEIALRKAFIFYFEEIIKIIGCHFHFCYNIDKQINSLGLRQYVSKYEILLAFTEKLKYLAFLPPQDIQDIFNYLVEQLPTAETIPLINNPEVYISPRKLLAPLIDYYVRYWLKITTPDIFSVYMEERRTNNDTERNNRSWNDFIGNHPNLVSYIDKLLLYIKDTHLDHTSRCMNGVSKRNLSEEEKRKEKIIKGGWARIEESKLCSKRERRIILLEFLQSCRTIKYDFVELNKTLITGEDESVPAVISDTCSVVRNTPWDDRVEFNENDWKCPICDKETGNEKSYYTHIESAHALIHCDQCDDLYNNTVAHSNCSKLILSTATGTNVSITSETQQKTHTSTVVSTTAAPSIICEDVMPTTSSIRRQNPRKPAKGRYYSYPPVEKIKSVKRELTPGARKAQKRAADWATVKPVAAQKVLKTAPIEMRTVSPASLPTNTETTSTPTNVKIESSINKQPKIVSIISFSKTKPALQIRAHTKK